MKQEAKDIAVGLANQIPGVSGYMATGQLVIMVLTGVLLCLQIAYYTRKWMREETKWGVGIKAWLVRRGWAHDD